MMMSLVCPLDGHTFIGQSPQNIRRILCQILMSHKQFQQKAAHVSAVVVYGVGHSTIETKAAMAGNIVYLCLVNRATNIPDRVSGRWGEKVVRRR